MKGVSAAMRIARHEWGLILKEPRFLLPFLIAPALLIGVQSYALFLGPPGSPDEILGLARTLLLMLSVLAPSLAVPLAADSFAGERERNTLEILLCLPIGMGTLFWGKVLGILPLPVLVGWAGQAIMLAILGSQGLLTAAFAPMAVKTLCLTPLLALFFSALASLISMRAESVRGAAQLAGLVMLAMVFTVLALAGPLLTGTGFFAISAGVLFLGSGACLWLAGRRFLRLH